MTWSILNSTITNQQQMAYDVPDWITEISLKHLKLHHHCARLDHRDINYSGPLDALRNHHIPNLMLQEDILCRLSGDVLATTRSLLGLPLGIPSPRRSQRSPKESSKYPR